MNASFLRAGTSLLAVLVLVGIWWLLQVPVKVARPLPAPAVPEAPEPRIAPTETPPARVSLPRPSDPVESDDVGLRDLLTVAVVDDRGAAIPGAHVEVEIVDEDHASLAAGLADAAGELVCRLPSRRVCLRVRADAAGRAGREVDVAVPVPTRLQIALACPATLRGSVSTARGVPAPVGTRVYAWSAMSLRARDFERRLRAGTGLLAASTGPVGEFELPGADPACRYWVVAGSAGWICESAQRIACDTSCHLVLRPLFGCRILARGPGGTEVPASISWAVRHRSPELPGVDGVDPSSIEFLASGMSAVPDAMSDRPRDWRDLLFAFVADEEGAALPGFGVDYAVPGFEPQTVETTLPRLRDTWPEVVAGLRPTALGFGDLEVILNREPGDLREFDGRAHMQVEIVPLSTPENAYTAPLVFRDGRAVVPGVPLGVYDIRVTSPFGWAFPATGRARIDIGNAGGRLDVPANTFGSVCVTLGNHDSATMSNSVRCDLWLGSESWARRGASWAPRFVLHGVRPGAASIQIATVSDNGVVKTARSDVEVLPGRILDVDLVWGTR